MTRVRPLASAAPREAPPDAERTYAMSVDVEEHFHAWALSAAVPRAAWPDQASRVEASTRRVLDLLESAGVAATFFVLGVVAERKPRLVREIVARGHELASHGWAHHKVGELGPVAFEKDVRRTRLLLEDLAGTSVNGYRAPSFSIGAAQWWAYERLAAAGYAYSSSQHPIRHDHYGVPEAPRIPFRPTSGPLLEVPVATVDGPGRRWSCAGGGHFRIMPYVWTRSGLSRVGPAPAVFYFHPWEIDPGQPRPPGVAWRSRLRHYTGLGRMEGKLTRLMRDFRWDRIDRVAPATLLAAGWKPAGAPSRARQPCST